MRYVVRLDEQHAAGFEYVINDEGAAVLSGNLFIDPKIRMYSFGYIQITTVSNSSLISGSTYSEAVFLTYVPIVTLPPVASNISLTGDAFGTFYYSQQHKNIIYRVMGACPATPFMQLAASATIIGHPTKLIYPVPAEGKEVAVFPVTAIFETQMTEGIVPTITDFADDIAVFDEEFAPIRSPSFLQKSALLMLNALTGVISKEETPYVTNLYFSLMRNSPAIERYDIKQLIVAETLPGGGKGDPSEEFLTLMQSDVKYSDVYPFYFYTTKERVSVQFMGMVSPSMLNKINVEIKDFSNLSKKKKKTSPMIGMMGGGKTEPHVELTKKLNAYTLNGALFTRIHTPLLFATMITNVPDKYHIYTFDKTAFYYPLYPENVEVELISQPLPDEYKDYYNPGE